MWLTYLLDAFTMLVATENFKTITEIFFFLVNLLGCIVYLQFMVFKQHSFFYHLGGKDLNCKYKSVLIYFFKLNNTIKTISL